MSLQTESNTIEKGKPFLVSFTIENRTDRDIALPTLLVILEKRDESGLDRGFRLRDYWTSLRVGDYLPNYSGQRQGAVFPRGQRIDIDVDIGATKWGKANQSSWPTEPLADTVPRDKYTLWFSIVVYDDEKDSRTAKSFRSNEVSLSVE